MHFRILPKSIQLIRTTYDPTSKKGRTETVGTASRRTGELAPGVTEKLTAAEQEQFETFQASQLMVEQLDVKLAAHRFPATVRSVIAYVEGLEDENERELISGHLAAAMFDLKKLQKRLNKNEAAEG